MISLLTKITKPDGNRGNGDVRQHPEADLHSLVSRDVAMSLQSGYNPQAVPYADLQDPYKDDAKKLLQSRVCLKFRYQSKFFLHVMIPSTTIFLFYLLFFLSDCMIFKCFSISNLLNAGFLSVKLQ